MYAFLRAIFDALLGFVGTNAGKGKKAIEADKKPEVLRRAGSRIRDYIRLRGLQSGSTGERGKPDSDR